MGYSPISPQRIARLPSMVRPPLPAGESGTSPTLNFFLCGVTKLIFSAWNVGLDVGTTPAAGTPVVALPSSSLRFLLSGAARGASRSSRRRLRLESSWWSSAYRREMSFTRCNWLSLTTELSCQSYVRLPAVDWSFYLHAACLILS